MNKLVQCSKVLIAEIIISERGKNLEHRTMKIFKVIKDPKHFYKVFFLIFRNLSKFLRLNLMS